VNWVKLINFVVPPEGESHDRRWYAWVGISLTLGWIFMWWSIGMIPAFGAGFAKAEETTFNTQMLLESRLSSVKQRQCLAEDTESKVYWTGELGRLIQLYKEKVGYDYREPPCEAIVVAKATDE